jgi:thioredoxin reductase (NADPH)
MRSGVSHRFDTIYSMLGTQVRSELATALGARCDADDNLEVDAHLQTTIAGLYAVGDVASGLNQISVATGHAAIAATAIHNRL